MNENKIIDNFQKRKYVEALVEANKAKGKAIIAANFYKYFIYEASGNEEQRKKIYNRVFKFRGYSRADIYYKFAFYGKKLINLTTAFYSFNDILRFIEEGLEVNNKHADTNYLKGQIFIERGKLQKGLELINNACKHKGSLLKDKEKLLLNFTFFNISKEDLKILEKELQRIKTNSKNRVALYFARLRLNIEALDKQKVRQLYSKKNIYLKNEKYLNVLMRGFYIKLNDYKNSLKFSKLLGLNDIADCYFKFKKYEKAVVVYNQIILQVQGYKAQYFYKIAECNFYLKRYNECLLYVDKVISDETEKGVKTSFYTDSIILKAKIEAENGDIHSIGALESEFYRQKYQNINNKLSYILILKAEICGKFHKRGISKGIQRVLNNANDFTTHNEYKDLIDNINLNLHFSTNLKTKLMKCKDDYISLNKEPSEEIEAIIDSVSTKERRIKLLANTKIIMLSNKAIKRFGETKELLSILVIAKDEIAKDRGQINSCIRLYLKLISMDPRNGVYYNNLSVMYNKIGDTKKAIKYIKLCIKLNIFSMESPLIFNNFLDFNDKKIAKSKRYTEARNLKDESIHALENLTKNYIRNLATGVIHTSRNFIKLTQRVTYKYRPFNVYTIESIVNGYLYFSTLKDLNDPLDLPIFQMQKNVLLRHALYDNKDFKIFCSSLNGNNSLMWSHYAESHKGICIGYKISSLPLDIGWNIIDYKQPSVRSNEVVQEEGILNPGLFSKLQDWNYEEELRLIRFKKDGDKLFYSPRIKSFEKSQKMECTIFEILLGYKFDESNFPLIKNIIIPINEKYNMLGLPSIKVYKMEQDEYKPFSLMRKEVILENK